MELVAYEMTMLVEAVGDTITFPRASLTSQETHDPIVPGVS